MHTAASFAALVFASTLAAGALAADAPSDGGALPASLGGLHGCFAATPDGQKMACVLPWDGRLRVEIKGVERRRVYRVIPLGTEARPADIAATPAGVLADVQRAMRKGGFEALEQPPADPDGAFPIPGTTCKLAVSADGGYVDSVGADRRRPWVSIEGIGGANALVSVALHRPKDRVLLVEDRTDAEGITTLRAVQVFPLSDLLARPECAPPAAPPAVHPR